MASGDTDKTIGQIVSIQYEHYHASTSSKSWALQGGLYTGSTTITSDTVTKTIGSGDVVKYVNTFTTLPTVSQFNNITYVRTLTGGSYAQTSSPYLTWRADNARPMRVIVSFYEEPPWVYHPQILSFDLKRGTSSGVQDDSGTRALLTLKLSLASSSYASSSTLRLYYSTGTVSTSSTSINLSSYVSTFLSGVTNNYTYITTTFNADYDYNFLLVFSCGGETATASAVLQNSAVALHISDCGVAIGDQVVNTSSANPTFECYYPAHFYGGISIGGATGDMASMLGIQTGTTAAITRTSNGTTELAVTFPKAYSAAPHVMVSFDTTGIDTPSGPFGSYQLSVSAITTTGFTLRMTAATSTSFSPKARWLAIGTLA